MEQRIRLYRAHTGACVHGYQQPLPEGEKKLPDCRCPIVGAGYLRNELDASNKPKRILHRSAGTKDWDEAFAVRENWLKWGRTEEPGSNFAGAEPTIEEAVQSFAEFQAQTETAGRSTKEKYGVLFSRLRTWAKLRG